MIGVKTRVYRGRFIFRGRFLTPRNPMEPQWYPNNTNLKHIGDTFVSLRHPKYPMKPKWYPKDTQTNPQETPKILKRTSRNPKDTKIIKMHLLIPLGTYWYPIESLGGLQKRSKRKRFLKSKNTSKTEFDACAINKEINYFF